MNLWLIPFPGLWILLRAKGCSLNYEKFVMNASLSRSTREGSLVSTQSRKVLYLPPKAQLADLIAESRGESGVKIHTCFPSIQNIHIIG